MDGKAYTSTKDVIAYLVEHAPKKVARGTAFIDKVHEDKFDPNAPLLLAVRIILHSVYTPRLTAAHSVTRTSSRHMRQVSLCNSCRTVSSTI